MGRGAGRSWTRREAEEVLYIYRSPEGGVCGNVKLLCSFFGVCGGLTSCPVIKATNKFIHGYILGGTVLIVNFDWGISSGCKKGTIAISRISRNAQFEPAFREMKIMPIGSRVRT